jgi:hypothetical protein
VAELSDEDFDKAIGELLDRETGPGAKDDTTDGSDGDKPADE